MLFIGSTLVLYTLHYVRLEQVQFLASAIYLDETLRLIFGSLGAGLIVLNYIFYQIYSVNVHRDKIIAFDNPSGRVSLSLVALEDLVKRMLSKLSEVKDIKQNITASRKGLFITIRLILRSEVNIPEITSKVQELVKKKIQDIIGLDEPINVSIYIGKIIPEKIQGKSILEEKEKEKSEPNIPFQGYRK